ncbi:MAG: type IV pili methyl-accepting chemotaxis transducer N-terminal domain-containing protein [Betaproteobacteria bacterium]
MRRGRHWSLGAKLTLLLTPFLLVGLLTISATLWISWQLDGGAAAVNEAGRLRMQAWRLSLSAATGDGAAATRQANEFERSLELLRQGDAARPLYVPWDATLRERFTGVETDWQRWRARRLAPGAGRDGLAADTAAFVERIDTLVAGIERYMARWTATLQLLQLAMMALAVAGTGLLVLTGFRFVLEPLGKLKEGIEHIEGGDFGTRVHYDSSDEFGLLAGGFNGMAAQLQAVYRDLERKVAQKTAQLEEKRERLENLYQVTALIAGATALDELAQGFVERIARIARADGVALRWCDESQRRFVLLARQGLPETMVEREQCVMAGSCHCGTAGATGVVRVLPITRQQPFALPHCAVAGYATVALVPVRLHERLLGEIDLFFHAQVELSAAERSLYEALAAHLAAAMESLRLTALEKEAAVAEERGFLARELHDSIAQSLAFLKIQVRLMRDALAAGDAAQAERTLAEIDAGVRESYGDVRELLVNFRTRTNAEDIEPALQTTLHKFEHQSGVSTSLRMQGHGLPLPPDLQVQVLHIVQEALSNVRKHAHAGTVSLDVQQLPQWRFEVHDDGIGFDAAAARAETHVGLRIMAERAERIGATLEVRSAPGQGTSIVLTLPPQGRGAGAAADAARLATEPA